MDWVDTYEKWRQFDELDSWLKIQLYQLEKDLKQLEDCFYKNLTFGTGGMRGEIGPGPNRMNKFTVRKATEGLARYMEEKSVYARVRGVVIAYDSRLKSEEFALEAAKTLGLHGIPTYLFDKLCPTPILSFAIRHLNAYAGIVITASHNPPEYNGFKVYGPDGGQLPPKEADLLTEKVKEVKDELAVNVADEKELTHLQLLTILDDEVEQAYMAEVKKLVVQPDLIKKMAKELCIVYTPLHGTGNIPVREGLKAIGFSNVHVVAEQESPDPTFATVNSPNPEEHAAFELAIKDGKKLQADILLGTDPDADRVGVAVKNKQGNYQVLTGNQVGALILNYLVTQKYKKGELPSNSTVLKTIVTSELGRDIASDFGLETIDTLTGFKFIGEKIKEFEETKNKCFLFGYEESYGYLIGNFVRDKDAVQSCTMIAEVAAYYKSNGMTLYQGLLEIFEKYGYYLEDLQSITLKGKDGAEQIESIMTSFRENPPSEIGKSKIEVIEDYQTGKRNFVEHNEIETMDLPHSNVLKYKLSDGSWFCLRPSGTEPKIKFYFGVKGDTMIESEAQLELIIESVMDRVRVLAKEVV
ncbi:phospho-sugar mutase [Aquibacillus albus]|uniref:Phosphoglucomutase n=1 Tax=Aquibacillus albus TaxID=1168171 RepID=A0ABS2N5R4_9BACI|nr:phospho-sugar mutase [Aquibacillus albus]MBM7573475.1 phosphoglucomutase [Aquibacillus albus]